MKLRTKFVLFFVALIILLIGGLMYYINTYISNYLKQTAISNFRVIAELSESAYFTFTDLVKTRAVDWGSDGYIKNTAEKILDAKARGDNEEYQTSAKALGTYLREEKMKYGADVIMIDILDGNGIVIASSREDRVGTDEKEEEERLGAHRFSEAIRSERPEAFVSHVISEADESDEPMIHAVTRLFSFDKNSDGSPIPLDSVFLLHFSNTDTLAEILSGRRQMEKGALSGRALYERYETAEVYLANAQHLMISPARDNPDSILRQRVDTQPVHNCFNNKQEMSGEYISYNGKTVIGASMCLVEDQLVLIAEVSKDEILKPISSVRNMLMASGVLVIMLGLVGILLGGYWLLRPLFEIINAAQEVVGGNLHARASVKTKDEIGRLAAVFNQMLESISQSKEKLEEAYQKTSESAQALEQKVMELERFKKLTVGRELKMIEMKKRIKELGGGEEY